MANRLLDLLDTNEQAKQEIKSSTENVDTILTSVRNYLPDYSEDELMSDLDNIKKSRKIVEEGELNLDQLEKVAGGQGDNFFSAFLSSIF